MRIVLDTNSIIQCVGHHSIYRAVWTSILSGQNNLCVSNEILMEYDEILRQFFNPQFAETVIETIIKNPNTQFFTPHYHFNLITADPDDNKFDDCASKIQTQSPETTMVMSQRLVNISPY